MSTPRVSGRRRPGRYLRARSRRFSIRGQWELDRGPQYLAYDFWWHLGWDTLITSEWGTPNMVEDGVNPELLLAGKYGHALHVWDLQQPAASCRPSISARNSRWRSSCDRHTIRANPTGSSAWSSRSRICRRRFGHGIERRMGDWAVRKVIEIPAEPADPDQSAAAPQRLRGGAAARHGHQPCLWTTTSFTYRAGAPENCASTTSAIRSIPGWPARCVWAASSPGLRIRRRPRPP